MGSTLWDYYIRTAKRITQTALDDISTLQDWEEQKEHRREQFLTMMGLNPLPGRCNLNPRVVGSFSGRGYTAEGVAFEILPDVHATANLYRPNPMPPGKLPAVLYLCGHAPIGTHGLQEHAIMWARRGYVCLILDTMEQHDNRGDHHALMLRGRLDWISRGYIAAGGELWNSIRALDFLLSLPEVDAGRIGATGASGGGAHSFFIGVADERIKAVAPVAGVDTLQFFIKQRRPQHHCDCMLPLNIFQQDTSDWAALIAPRPLLLCFAKQDSLFSPAGYRILSEKARRIYALHGVEENCQLFEYPGPHGYKPGTVEAINRWFDRHVAGEERPMIGLEGEEQEERITTVFNGAPPETDHLDILPELLTRRGGVRLPDGAEDWEHTREEVRKQLREVPLSWLERSGEELRTELMGDYLGEGAAQRYILYRGEIAGVEVWFEMMLPLQPSGKVVVGLVAPGQNTHELLGELATVCGRHAVVTVEPRGAGLTGYDRANDSIRTEAIRAGYFVGLTDTLLGIHDLMKTLQFLRSLPELEGQEVYLYGRGDAGVACLYAAMMDEDIAGVIADSIPTTHLAGGHIIGVLRVLDIPQAIGMIAPRPVGLVSFGHVHCLWAGRAYQRLGCAERLVRGPLNDVVRQVLAHG